MHGSESLRDQICLHMPESILSTCLKIKAAGDEDVEAGSVASTSGSEEEVAVRTSRLHQVQHTSDVCEFDTDVGCP